jgi:hypothetical protein
MLKEHSMFPICEKPVRGDVQAFIRGVSSKFNASDYTISFITIIATPQIFSLSDSLGLIGK